MKQIFHRLQPVQVYIVLVLSLCYFSVQMYISQKSQSITLLVHAYHMLCNIIALSGCIITIKVSLCNKIFTIWTSGVFCLFAAITTLLIPFELFAQNDLKIDDILNL